MPCDRPPTSTAETWVAPVAAQAASARYGHRRHPADLLELEVARAVDEQEHVAQRVEWPLRSEPHGPAHRTAFGIEGLERGKGRVVAPRVEPLAGLREFLEQEQGVLT